MTGQSPTSIPPIGIVGLGMVGSACARTLIADGLAVLGYQRRGSAELEANGGEVATSVEELFDRCRIILLALPSADALVQVVGSVAGGGTPAHAMTTTIDLSAVDVGTKSAARDIFANLGIAMLDAPVGGSPGRDSSSRFESIFASGNPGDYARVERVLQLLASQVWYLGEFGTGSKMKLINLAVVAMHTAVAAEALQMGIGAGIDGRTLVDVLKNSPASSWVVRDRVERMLEGPYMPPHGSVQAIHDILGRVEKMADQLDLALPLLRRTFSRYAEAMERGLGEHDVTTLYTLR